MPPSLTRAIALASTLLLLSAAPAEPPPAPPRQQVDRDLLRMRNQLSNASTRLEHGIVDMDSEPGQAPTPMRLCCGSNLKHLRAAVKSMGEAFDALESCYDSEGLTGGPAAVGFARNDLEQFARGVERLESTPEERNTKMVMQAMTRAYLLLAESIETIPACPAEPPPRGTGKKSKNKSKP